MATDEVWVELVPDETAEDTYFLRASVDSVFVGHLHFRMSQEDGVLTVLDLTPDPEKYDLLRTRLVDIASQSSPWMGKD